MLWTTKETLGEKEKMHGTNYRVVFDRCWFVHGRFCSINLQGTWNGENQQKLKKYRFLQLSQDIFLLGHGIFLTGQH